MTVRFHPLDRGYQITSGFGPRDGGFHTGIDFGWDGGSAGRPVYAIQAGTVQYAGAAAGYGGPDPAGWLVIDSDDSQGGGVFEYGHIIREVGVGDQVRAGQRIARINPNTATNGGVAPHCHISYMPYAYNPSAKKDWRDLLAGALYPGDAPPAPAGIDAEALAQAMGCPLSRAREMLPGYIVAMQAAQITTPARAAMFAAQIGHESVGLQYMAEIADGSQYEWRADLGNTQPGDGRRFKGSGPIQLTGRANFRRFSQWCHSQGKVPSPSYFEDNPQLVRDEPRWGFLAASWYWVVARPQINSLCDRGDLEGVTRAINGGLNGLDDRRARWNRCRALGDRLLPGKDYLDMNPDQLKALVYECLATYVGPIGSDVKDTRQQITGGRDAGQYPGWKQLGDRTVVDALAVIGVKLGIDGFKAPAQQTKES